MAYFRKFPSIRYQIDDRLVTMVDIFRGFKFSNAMKYDSAFYGNETWGPQNTVVTIATAQYNDPYGFWQVCLENDIIDPMMDPPKPSGTFQNYIKDTYEGRGWFVSPEDVTTEDNYRPGVNNKGKSASIRGANLVWGDFSNSSVIAFYQGTPSGTYSTEIEIQAYPTTPDGTVLYDGVPWFLSSAFKPRIGSVLVCRPDENKSNTIGTVDASELLTDDYINDDSLRFVRVTKVDQKSGVFWVEAVDRKGSLPTGEELIASFDNDDMNVLGLWSARCYDFDMSLGRALIELPAACPPVTITYNGVDNEITGTSFVVADDLVTGLDIVIRSGYVVKEIQNAFDAADGFNNVLGEELGSSELLKYIGLDNDTPTPVTVLESERDKNETFRNIKILIPSAYTKADQIIKKELSS